jgi:ankyrin repeat protein
MTHRVFASRLSMALALGAGLATPLAAQNNAASAADAKKSVRVSTARESRATPAIADAAQRGDLAEVRALLSKYDVNAPLGDGMTALHWAAERGDVAMTMALLRAGAKPTGVTVNAGYTPLHVAARSGSAEIVKALLAAGADPKAVTTTGATAMHLAAEAGNADAIKALIAKKADVNAKETSWGQTPLMFAAAANRAAAVKALIAAGADPKARTRTVSLTEELARSQAAAKKRNEILWGFLPEATRDSIKKAEAKKAAEARAAFGGAGGRGAFAGAGGGAGGGRGAGRGGPPGAPGGAPGDSTRIAAAAPDTAFKVPNLPDKFFTPAQIEEAVLAGRKMYTAEKVGAATQEVPADTTNGFQFGLEATVGSMGGLTALHHAVRQGNIDAALALIDGGADINAPMAADSTTPLLMAAVNGQYDMAMALIKKGANAKLASTAGLTPLYAVLNTYWHPKSRYPQPQAWQVQKTSYLEVMDALIKSGADVNATLKKNLWFFGYSNCGNANCGLEMLDGTTPFWRAAYAVDLDAMKLLKAAGAIDTMPSHPPARRARPGAGAPGGPDSFNPNPDPAAQAAPVGVGTYPIHSAAGVGYGNGFAGNAHRHAPDGWMPVMKYLVEELHHDVNKRDAGGFTPLHHAAARGDNEMILYLVSKGADPKAVARNGQTTVDMANGPVQRLRPFPETIQLLEKLGAKNNHKCVGC